MRQPDCYLREYLVEIHRRYGVKVTVGRLSIILKELGITHKKVYRL
jgi:transposase